MVWIQLEPSQADTSIREQRRQIVTLQDYVLHTAGLLSIYIQTIVNATAVGNIELPRKFEFLINVM